MTNPLRQISICLLRLVFAALAVLTLAVPPATAADAPPDTRIVVIHAPGPAWKPGVSFREQPGIQAHVDYYKKALADGTLALGGPFLDGSGGMMISKPGVKLDDMQAFAAADPAVKAGLLTATVRPWLVALHGAAP